MTALAGVSRSTLLSLADGLETGRLAEPFDLVALRRHVPSRECGAVKEYLAGLAARGFTAVQAAVLLRAVADERADGQAAGDRVRLVWTGPETHSSTSRDTFVVMQELFDCAQQSVLISGFTVHRGRVVLAALGRRMETRPDLRVRLFLNIHRPYRSTASEAVLLREFREKFVAQDWGNRVLPEVYYDPRALAAEPGARASLHAKCVVIDDRIAFVTSANLTEAAQQRNIEAGILVEDEGFARSLRAQFDALVDSGALRRLPL